METTHMLRCQRILAMPGKLHEQSTISERLNGLRFPDRICSLNVLVSRMTEGRKNFSDSS